MNDLSKKREEEISGETPSGKGRQASEQGYYKKLGAYLLLVYQAYLNKETQLEPEIKSSLFRMVKLNPEFPLKIRMIQMEYLNPEDKIAAGEWDESKENLFPWEDTEIMRPLSAERKKTIAVYKEVILQLLQSS
jgi:hypothetical protein